MYSFHPEFNIDSLDGYSISLLHLSCSWLDFFLLFFCFPFFQKLDFSINYSIVWGRPLFFVDILIWLPDAVEYFSVGEDANVDVWHYNVMKVTFTLVGEEEIGHPDFVRICQRQILQFTCNFPTDKVEVNQYAWSRECLSIESDNAGHLKSQ